MKTGRKYRDIGLIILFTAALCLPGILIISGYKLSGILKENRIKAKLPGFKIPKPAILNSYLVMYTGKFNTWFDDNFSFREPLIMLNRNIKLRIMETNPFPEKFVIGREGWMFLGNDHSHAISESKGLLTFTEKELKKISRNLMESQRFFDREGIRFYLAIAPEKSTVYGKFIPIVQSAKSTKLEQVRQRLAKTGIAFIDLKKDFTRLENPVIYYKYDSHWNEFGEFTGCQTLISRIKEDFPQVRIMQVDDYIIDTIRDYKGDNAQMLFLPWIDNQYVFRERKLSGVLELPDKYSIPSTYLWDPANYERRFECKQQTLKVLIFHDSFFREMPKFIAPSFRETVFIWAWWDKKIILNEKPDIVIYEKTERDIDHLLFPLK